MIDKNLEFDLIKSCIERLIEELGIQFVGVGSGDREYLDFFRYLNNKYPGKVHVSLGYSLEIGKKIYSGADIYVDGNRIGEIGSAVIKDRKIMSTDGVLIVILNLDLEDLHYLYHIGSKSQV